MFSHVYLVTGAADDRGEHGPGGIVSGEASLHKTGAVVAHEGGSFIVVTHVEFWRRKGEKEKHFSTLNEIYMLIDAACSRITPTVTDQSSLYLLISQRMTEI